MNFKNGFSGGFFTYSICVILILLSFVISSCGSNEIELDSAMQDIISYKFGDSREPLSIVTDLVTSSNGFPSIRLNLEKQFVTVLASDATLGCKEFICRQLWVMGTDVSVPQLTKMLSVEQTSDMARYALEKNTSELAGNAFRNALDTAEGKVLIGVINSLGNRKDTECTKFLKTLESGPDEKVSAAATAALSKIEN